MAGVLVLVASGCGGEEATGSHSVTGYVVATDEVTRICQALTETFPLQYGESSITVRGLDLSTIPAVRSEQGVVWTDQQVTLRGVPDAGTLDDATIED